MLPFYPRTTSNDPPAPHDSYTIVTSTGGYGAGGYGPRASACRLPETQIKRESETETEMTAGSTSGVSRIRRAPTSVNIATKTNEGVGGM
jgi:hypothetical protein